MLWFCYDFVQRLTLQFLCREQVICNSHKLSKIVTRIRHLNRDYYIKNRAKTEKLLYTRRTKNLCSSGERKQHTRYCPVLGQPEPPKCMDLPGSLPRGEIRCHTFMLSRVPLYIPFPEILVFKCKSVWINFSQAWINANQQARGYTSHLEPSLHSAKKPIKTWAWRFFFAYFFTRCLLREIQVSQNSAQTVKQSIAF